MNDIIEIDAAIHCIQDLCERHKNNCETCPAMKKEGCMFVDYPDEWEDLSKLIMEVK